MTPSFEPYFRPSFVITETSNPPIGTGASLEIDTVTCMTSSSSSSISILISRISALKEPFVPEVAVVMSLTRLSTNPAILEDNHL